MTEYVIEELARRHAVADFSCPESELDRWLRGAAMAEHKGGMSATHVSVAEPGAATVMGYFTLCPTTVLENPEASSSVRRDGYPGYLLAKIARGDGFKGHGEELITEAFVKAVDAVKAAGGRFLVVDPMQMDDEVKTERLRRWYLDLGFKAIDGTTRLYMRMKELRQAVEK